MAAGQFGGFFGKEARRLLTKMMGSEEEGETAAPPLEEPVYDINTLKSSGSSTLTQPQQLDLIQSAVTLINDGDYDNSIPLLLNVLENGSVTNKEANMLLGTVLFQLGRPEEAESFLYQAVKASEWTDTISIINFITCLRENKDVQLAERTALYALSRMETFDDTAVSSEDKQFFLMRIGDILGILKMELSKYREASEWQLFGALMNKEASLAKDLFLLASTMTYPVEYRDTTIAVSVLIEAIKIFPKEATYYYYLGLATYMNGDIEEAIKLYQGSIDLDTQRRAEKEEKANTLSKGDGEEESENGELPLPDVWPALGTAMQALERNTEAIDCYTRANVDNMEDASKAIFLAHYGMALCHRDIAQFDKGKEMTGMAMRLLDTHTEVIEAFNFCKHAT